jgi:Ca2+-binding RTX toxin-like protein
MTISYLTESQLVDQVLTPNGHLDSSVQSAVINQLRSDGIYNPALPNLTAWVQTDLYIPPTSNIVQVVDITQTGTTYVQTEPNLAAIVFTPPSGSELVVSDAGAPNGDNVFVGVGQGNDTVVLQDAGNDTVLAGSGTDIIGGGHGKDVLIAGAGNDTIYGGVGAETLEGGAGNSTLVLGTGGQLAEGDTAPGGGSSLMLDFGYSSAVNTLSAGTGNDTMWGYGYDVLEGSSTAGKHSEMHGGTNSTLYSNSTASNYNQLGSGSTNSTNGDTLYGGAGADTLYGGGGADSLYAGTGDNLLLTGTNGGQHLFGDTAPGGGNATLADYWSNGANNTLTAGSGNDVLIGEQGDTFNSAADATGSTFWVYGGAGNSTLTGGSGNDVFHIETKTGNDTVTGGAGTDNKLGFLGRSVDDISSLTGSAGNYVLTFDNNQKITIHGVQELYFTDNVIKLS